MSANKIKYGISKCYYAVKSGGTYGTPKALPGAVSIALAPQGDQYTFYADNIAYYRNNVNNGYQGDLELAIVTDDFLKDILGDTLDGTAKVLIEQVQDEAIEFALGFQVEGDQQGSRFWFYNCTATRPEIASDTKEDSIEAQTEKVTIKTAPDSNGYTRVRTTDTTPDATYTAWFDSVWTPSATTT